MWQLIIGVIKVKWYHSIILFYRILSLLIQIIYIYSQLIINAIKVKWCHSIALFYRILSLLLQIIFTYSITHLIVKVIIVKNVLSCIA